MNTDISPIGQLSDALNKGNNREILLSEDVLFSLHMVANTVNAPITGLKYFSQSDNTEYEFSNMGIEHTLNTLRKTMKGKTESVLLTSELFFNLTSHLYDKMCLNIEMHDAEVASAK